MKASFSSLRHSALLAGALAAAPLVGHAQATDSTPAPPPSGWAAYGISVGNPGKVARLEGGLKGMNYAFLDVSDDGKSVSHFAQAQATHPLGKGVIIGGVTVAPTAGVEIQLTNSPFIPTGELARAQAGLDVGFNGGFAGLRVAPRIDVLGLAPDNDVQVSLNGAVSKGPVTVGAWYDANLNRGAKPFFVGETYAFTKLGTVKNIPVEASLYRGTNIAGTSWRAGLRFK